MADAEGSKAPLWATLIATFFGIGYMRRGPGTWASAATMLLWAALAHALPDAVAFIETTEEAAQTDQILVGRRIGNSPTPESATMRRVDHLRLGLSIFSAHPIVDRRYQETSTTTPISIAKA